MYLAIVDGRLYDTHAERQPFVSTLVLCPACDGDDSRESWTCGDGCCVEWDTCTFCEGEQFVEYSKALSHDENEDYWP